MSALEGTLIGGRYRLEAQVGAGGMSTVHRANDEKLQRPVAVKLMHRATAADADHLERFRREAKSVANLSDPNLVGVIDAGEDEGRPFIVLEYVDGETLKERIKRNERLDVAEAIAYAIEISRGLSAANDGGIIHRDVKPQNVLIDREGRAKVTDFGIARTLDEEGLTADGRVIGTTDYVSPEQALGEQVGAQSDIYSLGIVLFEMLTGKVPFSADSPVAVAMCHVRDPMPDVQTVRPDVSATVAAIVDKCTAKDPAERYSTFRELTADLESALALEASRRGSTQGEATSVLETLPPQTKAKVPIGVRSKRSRALTAGLVIAALAVVGVVAWEGLQRGTGSSGPTPPGLTQVSLAAGAAHPYDPFGDAKEHDAESHLMLDRDPTTAWTSETYNSGSLEKGGFGVALDAAPGTAAKAVRIKTNTPGFTASVWAADGPLPSSSTQGSGPAGGTPASGPPAGWSRLSPPQSVSKLDTIRLATNGQRHRWYLVWITTLPPGSQKVDIQEVSLLR